jgi:hypothetical protein
MDLSQTQSNQRPAIVGIPFQAAGYGAHVSILQLICFALIFIVSIPAALAMLRSKDE